VKSFLVLAVVIAAGIGGAFLFIGRTAAKTTSTLLAYPDQAASATAQANVASALTAMQAYGAANGGYSSATVAGLGQIDAGLGQTISLHDLTATSFCVQSTVRSATASATGPGGSIVDAPCP
jgi:uncharacterized protein (UPF0333 family)